MCRSLAQGGRRCNHDREAANARRKQNRHTRKKLAKFLSSKGMTETAKEVQSSPPSTIPYVVEMMELDGVISSTEMPGRPNYDPDMEKFKKALEKDGGLDSIEINEEDKNSHSDKDFEEGEELQKAQAEDKVEELDNKTSAAVKDFNDSVAALNSSYLADYENEHIAAMAASVSSVFGDDLISISSIKDIQDLTDEQREFLRNVKTADLMKLQMFLDNGMYSNSDKRHSLLNENLRSNKSTQEEEEEKEKPLTEEEHRDVYKKSIASKFEKIQEVSKNSISVEDDKIPRKGFFKDMVSAMNAQREEWMQDDDYYPYHYNNINNLGEALPDEYKDFFKSPMLVKISDNKDDYVMGFKMRITQNFFNRNMQLTAEPVLNGDGSGGLNPIVIKSMSPADFLDPEKMSKTFSWLEDENKIKNEFSKLKIANPNVQKEMREEDEDFQFYDTYQKKISADAIIQASMYHSSPSKLKPKVSETILGNKNNMMKYEGIMKGESDGVESNYYIKNLSENYAYRKVKNNGNSDYKESINAQNVGSIATLSILANQAKSNMTRETEDEDKVSMYKSIGMLAGEERYIPKGNIVTADGTGEGTTVTAISEKWAKPHKFTMDSGITKFPTFRDSEGEILKSSIPSLNDKNVEKLAACAFGDENSTNQENLDIGERFVRSTIDTYTGSDYSRINEWISGQSRGVSADNVYTFQHQRHSIAAIAGISEVLSTGKYAEAVDCKNKPVTTFRGMKYSASKYSNMKIDSITPGDVIETDRFTSTSNDGHVANSFSADLSSQRSVRMMITSDKGLNLGSEMSLGDENEVIIPQGANFVVTRKEVNSDGVTLHLMDKDLMDNNIEAEYLND